MGKAPLQKKYLFSRNISRRTVLKIALAWAALFSLDNSLLSKPAKTSEKSIPTEPKNLDEPTPWQEGDPEPFEKEVPETEPEQTSDEAPPSQPIDDDRPEQPGDEYEWVYGYWWWDHRVYVWVPGYWAIPPQPGYVYIGGYWSYRRGTWIYVRGGWGLSRTTRVVTYGYARPALTAFVFTAPARIVRRNHHWNYYQSRRYYHRPQTAYRSNRTPVKNTVTTPTPRPAATPAPKPAQRQAPGPGPRPGARPGPGRR